MFCIKNYLSPRCVIFVVQLCISAIYMDNGLCFFRKIVELFADKQCTESYIAFAAKQFAERFAFSAQFSAGGYKNIVRCKVRIAPVIFVLAHQNVFSMNAEISFTSSSSDAKILFSYRRSKSAEYIL